MSADSKATADSVSVVRVSAGGETLRPAREVVILASKTAPFRINDYPNIRLDDFCPIVSRIFQHAEKGQGHGTLWIHCPNDFINNIVFKDSRGQHSPPFLPLSPHPTNGRFGFDVHQKPFRFDTDEPKRINDKFSAYPIDVVIGLSTGEFVERRFFYSKTQIAGGTGALHHDGTPIFLNQSSRKRKKPRTQDETASPLTVPTAPAGTLFAVAIKSPALRSTPHPSAVSDSVSHPPSWSPSPAVQALHLDVSSSPSTPGADAAFSASSYIPSDSAGYSTAHGVSRAFVSGDSSSPANTVNSVATPDLTNQFHNVPSSAAFGVGELQLSTLHAGSGFTRSRATSSSTMNDQSDCSSDSPSLSALSLRDASSRLSSGSRLDHLGDYCQGPSPSTNSGASWTADTNCHLDGKISLTSPVITHKVTVASLEMSQGLAIERLDIVQDTLICIVLQPGAVKMPLVQLGQSTILPRVSFTNPRISQEVYPYRFRISVDIRVHALPAPNETEIARINLITLHDDRQYSIVSIVFILALFAASPSCPALIISQPSAHPTSVISDSLSFDSLQSQSAHSALNAVHPVSSFHSFPTTAAHGQEQPVPIPIDADEPQATSSSLKQLGTNSFEVPSSLPSARFESQAATIPSDAPTPHDSSSPSVPASGPFDLPFISDPARIRLIGFSTPPRLPLPPGPGVFAHPRHRARKPVGCSKLAPRSSPPLQEAVGVTSSSFPFVFSNGVEALVDPIFRAFQTVPAVLDPTSPSASQTPNSTQFHNWNWTPFVFAPSIPAGFSRVLALCLNAHPVIVGVAEVPVLNKLAVQPLKKAAEFPAYNQPAWRGVAAALCQHSEAGVPLKRLSLRTAMCVNIFYFHTYDQVHLRVATWFGHQSLSSSAAAAVISCVALDTIISPLDAADRMYRKALWQQSPAPAVDMMSELDRTWIRHANPAMLKARSIQQQQKANLLLRTVRSTLQLEGLGAFFPFAKMRAAEAAVVSGFFPLFSSLKQVTRDVLGTEEHSTRAISYGPAAVLAFLIPHAACYPLSFTRRVVDVPYNNCDRGKWWRANGLDYASFTGNSQSLSSVAGFVFKEKGMRGFYRNFLRHGPPRTMLVATGACFYEWTRKRGQPKPAEQELPQFAEREPMASRSLLPTPSTGTASASDRWKDFAVLSCLSSFL